MTLILQLAPDAQEDIHDILEWSVERFGPAVRDGYEALIGAAIDALLSDQSMSAPTGDQSSVPASVSFTCGPAAIAFPSRLAESTRHDTSWSTDESAMHFRGTKPTSSRYWFGNTWRSLSRYQPAM